MLVRTLHGGPFGMLTVANSTVAIDVLPSSRRTEGIGYYGLSNNLAMAIAPTVGIFVYKYSHSFELLFWIALVVACCGWMVDATIDLKSKDIVKNKSKLSLDRFFLMKGWLLGVNMVAFGFSFGVLSNYLAIYGKEVMGITGGTGTYFMLCSIGLILSRLQGGKALRQGRLTHNAGAGMVISLVGYTLFILMPTLNQLSIVNYQLSIILGYYGSALLIGLGNGHMWPAFQNMTINVAENNQRGTANSTILISWDIGMGLGILLGGVVSELAGYGAAFWTVAVVNAMGVILFFAATKQFFLARNLNPTVH
jgi:predicted MFS family arabinose efflux permease